METQNKNNEVDQTLKEKLDDLMNEIKDFEKSPRRHHKEKRVVKEEAGKEDLLKTLKGLLRTIK